MIVEMSDTPNNPDESPGGPGMSSTDRQHFKFAAILIFCCVFTLPVLGAIWILLMRWGVIDRPH